MTNEYFSHYDAHNDPPDLSVWAQFDESASVVSDSVPRELHAYISIEPCKHVAVGHG